MLILGVDPGSQKTGYGIIDYVNKRTKYVCSGCIVLGVKSLSDRLLKLSETLDRVIKEYRPEYGVVEKIFLGKNAQSALVLGHARGVVLLKIAQFGLPVYEYTPLDVKKTMVGVGRASKEQVQHMVKILLNQRQRSFEEDESDALAVAITHSHHLPY